MGCSSRSLRTSIHQEMELKCKIISSLCSWTTRGKHVCSLWPPHLHTPTHTPTSKRDGQPDRACVGTVQVYHFRRYITFRTRLFCDRCSCYRSGMQTKRTFCFALKTDGFTAVRKFTRQRGESADYIRAHWTPRLSSLQEISRKNVCFSLQPLGPIRQVTCSGSGCSVHQWGTRVIWMSDI